MTNVEYIGNKVANAYKRAVNCKGYSKSPEAGAAELMEELLQLCRTVGNKDIVQHTPKGCNVVKSENFQLYYNEKEVQIVNKYF